MQRISYGHFAIDRSLTNASLFPPPLAVPQRRRCATQVLSMSADDYRKGSLFLGESIDVEFTLPDLVGQTEILTEEHR